MAIHVKNTCKYYARFNSPLIDITILSNVTCAMLATMIPNTIPALIIRTNLLHPDKAKMIKNMGEIYKTRSSVPLNVCETPWCCLLYTSDAADDLLCVD